MKNLVGIAFHSPIDVASVIPINTSLACLPSEEADILIIDFIPRAFKAKLCVVIESISVLKEKEIKILDLGKDGQILSLKPYLLDKAFKAACKS